MKFSRYVGLLVVGGVLMGLAACSSQPSVGTPGGGGKTVTVTKVGTVPWVAVQDGAGAWQALSGSSFVVNDVAGKYGVAWACTLGSGQPLVRITQETTADGTAVTASCQATGASSGYSVGGAVYGIQPSGSAFVAVGTQSTSVPYASSGSPYSLGGIPAGVQTALSYGLTSGGAFGNMQRTNLTVNGNITNNINVGLGVSITGSDSLSLTGVPGGESPALSVELASPSAPAVALDGAAGTSLTYPLVPSGLAQAGDAYVYIGTAEATTSATDVLQAKAFVSQSPSNGAALLLPAALSGSAGVGVTGAGASTSWGAVGFTSNGLNGYAASVAPTAVTSAVWTVTVTGDWLGSATGYDFPDFSSIAGWNSNWDFPTAQAATASVLALHANVTLNELLAFSQAQDYAGLPDGTSLDLTERSATGTY